MNTSKFYQTAAKVDVVLFEIISILDLLAAAFIHQILHYCITSQTKKHFQRCHIPSFIVNVPFLVFYIFIFVITFMDMEVSREMQMTVSVDYIKAYMLGVDQLFGNNYAYTGQSVSGGSIDVLVKSFQNNVTHWVVVFLGIILASIVALIFLILNFRVFVNSVVLQGKDSALQSQEDALTNKVANQTSKQLTSNTDIQNKYYNANESQSSESLDNNNIIVQQAAQNDAIQEPKVKIKYIQPKRALFNWFVPVQAAVLIVDITLFCYFMTCNTVGTQIYRYVPAHWNLYKSAQTASIDTKTYVQLVEEYRENNPGFYLDQRSIPVYPLVKGSREQFCSYNRHICTQFPETEVLQKQVSRTNMTPPSRQPNILFIIVESLSPSPKYLADEFLNRQNGTQKIYHGSIYDNSVLPNINNFATQSFTQVGTTSHGIPTIFGWFTLMTSEKPYLRGINMVSSVYNDVESFTKRLRDNGYYSYYQSPSPLDFDGKINWAFGREWFDVVNYYVPTQEQQKVLLIDEVKRSEWIADRVTSRQFLLQMTQLYVSKGALTADEGAAMFTSFYNVSDELSLQTVRNHLEADKGRFNVSKDQPLLSVYMNVDTHTPFSGYDKEKYYDPYQKDQDDEYAVMLRSMDNYVHDILTYVQMLDNNTLVILTGDHGARERPIFTKPGEHVKNNTIFNEMCQFQNFGYDNMFTTTSIIGALNRELYEEYNIPVNVTLNSQSDHDDLIYTLESMVLQNQHPPTSRNGNNLLTLFRNIETNERAQPQKLSVSTTHLYAEFKQYGQIFRGNMLSSDGGIIINSSQYPTCVQYLSNTRVHQQQSQQQLYEAGTRQAMLLNYLQQHNQLYNIEFDDNTCIVNTETQRYCQLPVTPKTDSFQKSNVNFIVVCYVVIFGCFTVIAMVVSLLASKCYGCYEKQRMKAVPTLK